MRWFSCASLAWGWAALCGLVLTAPLASAGEKKPPPAFQDVVVLDLERGSYRLFMAWKTPVLVNAEGQTRPLPEPKKKDVKEEDRKPYLVRESARPADNWRAVEFDDSKWPRVHDQAVVRQQVHADIYSPGNPAEWNLVCLRGKFRVTDPDQVKDLKLALGYYGGAVIYVNGVELHRGHLPAGELKTDALADRYPEEAYVRPDGKLYAGVGAGMTDSTEFAERIRKSRNRTIPPKGAPDGVIIPGKMLRKGINAIAIEVRTAPVSDLAIERPLSNRSYEGPAGSWPHAGVLEARLSSPTGAGLIPNAGPQPGIEVANCQPLETVRTWDYSHPTDKLVPIRLIGVRGGTFSGKIALSSASAIRNLKASVSELAQEGGKAKLPVTAARVRWAEPSNGVPGVAVSWNITERFDRLLAEMPAEVPALAQTRRDYFWGRDLHRQSAPTAVAVIWVTVQVPEGAAPGEYKGTLMVEADGAPGKIGVPVELKVHDWKMPALKDYAQRYNCYQSPDTVAQYYKVPLWSDKHWELIGKSFEAFRQVGNSVCMLSLVVKVPTLNNTESMIRWVKKPDGTYDYDFTIAEKYMDLYEKVCGKPAILELFAWEHQDKDSTGKKVARTPLSVTVVDPATGKVESMPQPPYDTPANEAFWKPVLTELKKRLEKRGWHDVTAMCYTSYCWGPTKEQVDIYKNIWPDGKWMNCSHGNPQQYNGSQGAMPVVYSEWVWGCGGLYDPDRNLEAGKAGGGRNYPRPWKLGIKRIEVAIPRFGVGPFYALYDRAPLVLYRACAEAALQGGIRGLGRMGGDFWPLPVGKNGQSAPLCDGYAQLGPVVSVMALVSPGPNGAIFNERLEMFRESVQVVEAIAFLQMAMEAKQVDGELAKKIDDLLDERARYYLRTRANQECNWLSFECSDWQGRDDRLFALAAEVSAKSGNK